MIDSGLFVGTLRHRRFAPVAHAFTYPLFMALLDIDRVAELMDRSRLTSHNRWNWASFDDRDHLGDPRRPLRERLVADAARHAIDVEQRHEQRIRERVRDRSEPPMAQRADEQPRVDHHSTPSARETLSADCNPSS